jgi:hypothetical protein
MLSKSSNIKSTVVIEYNMKLSVYTTSTYSDPNFDAFARYEQ